MSRCIRKPSICICENSCAVIARLINCTADQRLCFRSIVRYLFFLNPKFQKSSLCLRFNRPVCVRRGRKPILLVSSRTGSYALLVDHDLLLPHHVTYTYMIRMMFFNSCHLRFYSFCRQSMRMLFICDESPIFSGQIGIKIISLRRAVIK